MGEIKLDRYSDLVVSASIIYTAKEISDLGYKIVQSSDFSKFKQICQMRDGRMLTEQCDEAHFDFTSGNSFSLILFDEFDRLVATIAARNAQSAVFAANPQPICTARCHGQTSKLLHT